MVQLLPFHFFWRKNFTVPSGRKFSPVFPVKRKALVSTRKHRWVLANVNLKLSKSLVTSSFHELQDQFLLSYENGTIDDNEFSALQEEFMSKNLDFSYEEHNRVLLEEMNNNHGQTFGLI